MNNGIEKDEERIRGMDFIHHLFREETVQELNGRYIELLTSLDGQKVYRIEEELVEILKEYDMHGMWHSSCPVMPGKGIYEKFVFREKFLLLFPYTADNSIKLCKHKRVSVKIKNISKMNCGSGSMEEMRFREIRSGDIEDKDFFEFEGILKQLPGKIQKRSAALKKLLLLFFNHEWDVCSSFYGV